MESSRRVPVLLLAALTCGTIRADDSVSAVFTFDARYPASGQTPADWEAHEAVGLSERFAAATVMRAADLNGNGIPDVWEAIYGLSGAEAAANADPDGDGRTNLQEYNAGTNPVVGEDYLAAASESERWTVDTWIASTAGGAWTLVEVWALSEEFTVNTAGRSPDADKDGLPDWWERLYGLDEKMADAYLDLDDDGRTNLQEYNAGTNPLVADDWTLSTASTDEAFTADTRVWYTGGNPSFDTTFAVIKVSNGFVCDTGGLYYDWDGDGIPNWCETRYSRDGNKMGLNAVEDGDADGMSNYGEFVDYTDPTNAKSKFVIGLEPIRVEPVEGARNRFLLKTAEPASEAVAGGYKLVWRSVKGRTYSVFASSDLIAGWSDAPIAIIEGTGDVVEYAADGKGGAKFFKVSVRLSGDY